jgi:hypothetical protein
VNFLDLQVTDSLVYYWKLCTTSISTPYAINPMAIKIAPDKVIHSRLRCINEYINCKQHYK